MSYEDIVNPSTNETSFCNNDGTTDCVTAMGTAMGVGSGVGFQKHEISNAIPITIGSLYRKILAHLTDREIIKALEKYRDLMPQYSDWNRKLTQATDDPELGFRFLYRCGQIDDTNNKTMQKMLKYVDRMDVIPYFETYLYGSNKGDKGNREMNCTLVDARDRLVSNIERNYGCSGTSEEYILPQLNRTTSRLSAKKPKQYANTNKRSSKNSVAKEKNQVEQSGGVTDEVNPTIVSAVFAVTTPDNADCEPQVFNFVKTLPNQAQPCLKPHEESGLFECSVGMDYATQNPLPKPRWPARFFCDNKLRDTFDVGSLKPIVHCITPKTPHYEYYSCYGTLNIILRRFSNNIPSKMTSFTLPTNENMELWEAQTNIIRQSLQTFEMGDELSHVNVPIHFTHIDNLEVFWGEYVSGKLEAFLQHYFLEEYGEKDSTSELKDPLFLVYIPSEDYEFARTILLNKMYRQYYANDEPLPCYLNGLDHPWFDEDRNIEGERIKQNLTQEDVPVLNVFHSLNYS